MNKVILDFSRMLKHVAKVNQRCRMFQYENKCSTLPLSCVRFQVGIIVTSMDARLAFYVQTGLNFHKLCLYVNIGSMLIVIHRHSYIR